MYLLDNRVFSDISFMSILQWLWSQKKCNYERNIELFLINWPNLEEPPTKKRHPLCRLVTFWLMLDANHLSLHLQNQIDMLTLPLCSSLRALLLPQSLWALTFTCQITLSFYLNSPWLSLKLLSYFSQTLQCTGADPSISFSHVCWNEDAPQRV